MTKVFNPELLKTAINMKINQHGGLRIAARALKIDASYLSKLKDGDKSNPSDYVLSKLGLTKIVKYAWTK